MAEHVLPKHGLIVTRKFPGDGEDGWPRPPDVRFWEIDSLAAIRGIVCHPAPGAAFYHLWFSPDERHCILFPVMSKGLEIWSTESGQRIRTLDGG